MAAFLFLSREIRGATCGLEVYIERRGPGTAFIAAF